MATLLPSVFSRWKFQNDEEELRACVLSESNVQFMQNEMCIQAQLHMNIKFDPNNPMEFVQQEAELKGKIQILQWLLDASEAAVTALAVEAKKRSS